MLWTACLLVSCAPAAASEFSDSHSYLQREKVRTTLTRALGKCSLLSHPPLLTRLLGAVPWHAEGGIVHASTRQAACDLWRVHTPPRPRAAQGNLGLAACGHSLLPAVHPLELARAEAVVARHIKAELAGTSRLHQDALQLVNTDLLQPTLTSLRIVEVSRLWSAFLHNPGWAHRACVRACGRVLVQTSWLSSTDALQEESGLVVAPYTGIEAFRQRVLHSVC